MGITLCCEHGRELIAFVSPAIHAALSSARSDAAFEICRVRFVFDDEDYPPCSMWLDRDFACAASLSLDVVVVLWDLDEDWTGRLQPVCSRCLETWLQQQGVETSPSVEESEFVRIRDALRAELDPSLGAFFLPRLPGSTSGTQRPQPIARWFTATRCRPLDGGVRGPAGTLRAVCAQHGRDLLCSSSATPASAPAVEGPSVVVSPALDQTARRSLQAWARDALAFLAPHAAALDLLETGNT